MPPARRSSKLNSGGDSQNSQTCKTTNVKKDKDQWVFLVNDSILEVDGNEENKPVFAKLKHPRTEKGALFLFTHGDRNVYEVTSFKEEYRSWMIGPTVHSDGSLVMTSIVDPVFLALPYLIKTEKTGKYMTLDQIITDEEYPECNRLTNTSGMAELYNVAEVKGDDDLRAYKYSKDKTLPWLQSKTEKLADALSDRDICVSGAHSSTFVRSKRAMSSSREDYIRYAHGMVSDYLPEELSVQLRDFMGIPEVVEKKENVEPPSKKMKTEDITPTEDYSQAKSDTKVNKPVKLSTAQKKLSKTDTTGMKSLASFFSPKPKT